MTPFFDTRFIINTGKGGVGKTTLSAAMACAWAARGKRVLLMQLNGSGRISNLFGLPAVGSEITTVAPGICAVNATPADSLREYALMILKVRVLYRAVFENRIVGKLLRVMPGLPELTMLGKAYFHEQEIEDGRPRWDVIIIDAPATGHGRFLLQIPQVISSTISSGPMADESRRMVELLEDPDRTCVNLITLPEEMPVSETIELHRSLQAEFDIRIGAVIANRVLPPLVDESDSDRIQRMLAAHGTEADDVGALLSAAVFRSDRGRLQARYLHKLRRELQAPIAEVPFYFSPTLERSVLDDIANRLEGALG